MKRLEIFANQSIEEDLFEMFQKYKVAKAYTKIPSIYGVGKSGPRNGDHIWPEENFILIIYCKDSEAKKIKKAIKELKTFFTDEGIKLFEMSG